MPTTPARRALLRLNAPSMAKSGALRAHTAQRLARSIFTTGKLQLHGGGEWAPGAAKAWVVR